MNHVQKVRLLYKTCLKLHRRHIKADEMQAKLFMEAWAKYAIDLTKQMGLKGPHMAQKLGADLDVNSLDTFSGEQIAQLYELYQEAKKPIDTEKDPHLAPPQQ